MSCTVSSRRSTPEQVGSKTAAHYKLSLGSGEATVIRMRRAVSDFEGTNAPVQVGGMSVAARDRFTHV